MDTARDSAMDMDMVDFMAESKFHSTEYLRKSFVQSINILNEKIFCQIFNLIYLSLKMDKQHTQLQLKESFFASE